MLLSAMRNSLRAVFGGRIAEVESHAIQRIDSAPLVTVPFPHIYVESLLPEDYYDELLANLPPRDSLPRASEIFGNENYRLRHVLDLADEEAIGLLARSPTDFWRQLAAWLLNQRFRSALLGKFCDPIEARFPAMTGRIEVYSDAVLARDEASYSLLPHTDSKYKLVSALLYLARDGNSPLLGTSLYKPLDPEFRCAGGPSYPYADFRRVATMDYKPNSLFAFAKTDDSFHGVEYAGEPHSPRDLLMYNVRITAETYESLVPVS